MDNDTVSAQLKAIRKQEYPLELAPDAAEALVECIRRIMAAVPEDDRIFLRADYDLATSALWHPNPTAWESE